MILIGLLVEPLKSITAFGIFFSDSLISWEPKKQNTVSRPSSEAKYRFLASLTCELQWIHYLLQDPHSLHSSLALIFCDNQSAIHIAENSVFHERTNTLTSMPRSSTKITRWIDPFDAYLLFQSTCNIFTKALPPARLQSFLSKLNLLNLYGLAYEAYQKTPQINHPQLQQQLCLHNDLSLLTH